MKNEAPTGIYTLLLQDICLQTLRRRCICFPVSSPPLQFQYFFNISISTCISSSHILATGSSCCDLPDGRPGLEDAIQPVSPYSLRQRLKRLVSEMPYSAVVSAKVLPSTIWAFTTAIFSRRRYDFVCGLSSGRSFRPFWYMAIHVLMVSGPTPTRSAICLLENPCL